MFTFRYPEVGLEFLSLGVQRSVYFFWYSTFRDCSQSNREVLILLLDTFIVLLVGVQRLV